MAQGRSRDEFIQFLDWIGVKGLLPTNTASARKSVASKVLGMLSDEEASDVLSLDVDEIMVRFQNKNSQTYGPDSILTYRSRLRSSLDDFRSYCENPVGFKPAGRSQSKPKTSVEKVTKAKASSAAETSSHISHSPAQTPSFAHVLPIMIRADVTVQVGNIPHDLTETEARRIANIILAYAIPSN